MAEKRIPSANLNFENHKIEFLDANGKPINEDIEMPTAGETKSEPATEAEAKADSQELRSDEVKSKSDTQAKTETETSQANVKTSDQPTEEGASLTRKIYHVARTMMRYSPLGMTYVAGKDFLEKVDSLMNGDEIKKDHINLEQLVELIHIGKYKFDELNLVFNEMQAQDINVRALRKEVDDENILIHFNDTDGEGLNINIKYQGNNDD